MVSSYLWFNQNDPSSTLKWIDSQHQAVWNSSAKFYLHYPALQRWKLKTKEQHFKSIREKKGNHYSCKWCSQRSCNAKINTLDDFYNHVTQVSKNQMRYSFQTENQYREARGWGPVEENATNDEPKNDKPALNETKTKKTKPVKQTKKESTKLTKVKTPKSKKEPKLTTPKRSQALSTPKASTSKATSKPSRTAAKATNSKSTSASKISLPIKRRIQCASSEPEAKKIKLNEDDDNTTGDFIENDFDKEIKLQLITRTEPDQIIIGYEGDLVSEENKRMELKNIFSSFVSSLPSGFEPTAFSISVSRQRF